MPTAQEQTSPRSWSWRRLWAAEAASSCRGLGYVLCIGSVWSFGVAWVAWVVWVAWVACVGLVGLVGFVGLVGCVGLVGFVGRHRQAHICGEA